MALSFFIFEGNKEGMGSTERKIVFSPTVKNFIDSHETITILIASLGEGKTFGCIGALLSHAKRCGQPIRAAIIRDTLENIKLSIVPSFQEFFQDCPQAIAFKNEFKELTINVNGLRIQVDLFGLDDSASLGKLQGSSAWSLIWLNEPAPMATADRVNAGLSEDVYNNSVIRCVRHTGTPGRLLVDMNPADEDHWTYRRFIEEPDIDARYPLIRKKVWHVPYGENFHLKDESRQAAMKMYENDKASYDRYVLGKFAKIDPGAPVTPGYNQQRHLSPNRLIPAPGLVSFAFFDSWSNPSCVLGQITNMNRLIFLDTVRLSGSDIITLMELQVIPLLESPRWKGKAKAWRIGGDPTMKNMDQSNKLKSAAREVEKFFPGAFFEPGPREWSMIERHIRSVLRDSDARGEPMILLSADNRILDRGLSGSWHYHLNNQGKRTSSVPHKDEASHPCDAWASSVCVLLPSKISYVSKRKTQARAAKALNRARSYGMGGMR